MAAVFVLLLSLCASPLSAVAQTGAANSYAYSSPAAAYAACQSYIAASPPAGDRVCVLNNGSKVTDATGLYVLAGHGAYGGYWFGWKGYVPPTDSSCVSTDPSDAATTQNFDGKLATGFSMCVQQKDPKGSGATLSCKRTFTPKAPPTVDASGRWTTYGTLSASNSMCGTNAPGGWADAGGSAATGTPAPPTPTGQSTPAPQACGGGSCYDPNTDQYCATSEGKQFCVPGSTARNSAGGCVSSGNATLCAGSPNAPQPPVPPASPISDPPSSINAIDKTTQANTSTGANQTVTTVVYSIPGTQTTSGAKAGDAVKPVEQWCATDETGVKHCVPKADPGTAYCVTLGDGSKVCEPKDGKDKGTASGGQDCNAPPICSGDQPTCMVIDQQWLSRCRPRFGEDTNGQPNWTKVGDADGAGYATTDTPRGSVVSEVDGPGVDALDTSGFAGNTCPALPSFEAFGQTYSFDQDLFCRWLSTLRSVILLVAAFVSARILASGGKG